MLEIPFKWIEREGEREREMCDENWIEMRFLQDLLIAMEDRQILGSAEIATNFSKLSCPAASQESPAMFYISVFHSDRFLQEVLFIIEDMEPIGLDIIYLWLDPRCWASSSWRLLLAFDNNYRPPMHGLEWRVCSLEWLYSCSRNSQIQDVCNVPMCLKMKGVLSLYPFRIPRKSETLTSGCWRICKVLPIFHLVHFWFRAR